ncbi:MAG: apolipoprotein N-acyltransferase [Campylobacterota bacterium]|nr:apolipoprotein N-acyltransferase [Campylobacterota bacterium]
MLIKKSLFISFLLSFSLYCEYFGFSSKVLNTIVSLLVIYMLFLSSKKELFYIGFTTSILWFWWIAYSFVYYELSYLVPIVIIAIGFIYGILFYFISFYNNVIYKVIYIFLFSFINPFSFNWFKLELIFINSYLGISKYEFLIILIATAILIFFINKKQFKLAISIYLFIIISLIYIQSTNHKDINISKLKIYLNETNIEQNNRWKRTYKDKIIDKNIEDINEAIKNKYDIIIFPETSFPLLLNKDEKLKLLLLEKSKKISIVLGSLYEKENMYYNSTYLFNNNKQQIAHKVVLVPFGEAVPLPEKIRDFINDMFYNGAKDYETALKPTTFNIKGEKFRNAICYEATTDKIYENLDTNFIIAISNNAWFTPSHQSVLQRLLLKYYAKKYNVVIYSVTNKSKSGIITP